MTGLPAAASTGIGSHPGTDPLAATRAVFDAFTELPYLPELPERGAGSDMIGRSASVLVDLAVDLQPSGWRLVPRPGRDVRRSRDMLTGDLDALTEVADGYTGWLKLQLAGPWTLAASLELARGQRAVSDPGAVRDLCESLAAGAAEHLAAVRGRVPGARLLLQLDEPSLPAVVSGSVPTASGYGTLRAVAEPDVQAGLAALIAATGAPCAVHCCAPHPPVELFRGAGADAVAVDLHSSSGASTDAIAELIESGGTLIAGVLPAPGQPLPPAAALAATVRDLGARLGFGAERMSRQSVLAGSCGFAGAGEQWLADVLQVLPAAARALADSDPADPVR